MEVERQRGAGASQARILAVRVLERVERTRAFADLTLHHAMTRSPLLAPERALCTELVYGTLRWKGRIDFVLRARLDRDLEKLEPMVASALRLGAYQILFSTNIAPANAVDQAVHCIRALGAERATGLVNAVLRRLARDQDALDLPDLATDPIGHLTHALSLPEWLAARWLEAFGPEAAAELARASNEAPPLTIRVNRTRALPDALLSELLERFPDAAACQFARDGIVLGRRGNPARDPAFLSGAFTVQDEASQIVVDLLDPQPGHRALDTCAAPGTKTGAIAERVGPDGHVLALDRHRRRLGLVARDSRRLGLSNITTCQRDSTQPLLEALRDADVPEANAFDRVLVDAPCSGMGSLRRNADARWRVRESDIEELSRLQSEILRSAADVLKPGGRLVYSTCTLLPQENERVIEAFLEARSDFSPINPNEWPERLSGLAIGDGMLQCLPHRHDTDGFFAACLERRS